MLVSVVYMYWYFSKARYARGGCNFVSTDYKTSRHLPLDAYSFTPSSDALYHTSLAMKEYMGLMAVKLECQ